MAPDPRPDARSSASRVQPEAGETKRLEELAAAVADASPIDWSHGIGDPVAASLRALQELAGGANTSPRSAGRPARLRRSLTFPLVARRAVHLVLARDTLRAAAGVLAVSLVWFSFVHREEMLGDLVLQPVPLALVGLAALALLLGRWRSRVLDAIDLLFFRERRAPGPVLFRLAERLRSGLTVCAAADALVHEIDRALHPESIDVLLQRMPGGPLVSVLTGVRTLDAGSALVAMMAHSPAPFTTDSTGGASLVSLLPSDDRRWLDDGAVAILLPLHTAAGDLLGSLALGPKRSELPYSAADLDLLRAIATATASAIEHRTTPQSGADGDVAAECGGCGAILPSPTQRCRCGGPKIDAVLPPTVLGKFLLERRLGAGSMGVVYLAEDRTLGRRVALKTLPAQSPDRVRRMRLEARAMASVTHPNLAPIYETGSWRGVPLLVVEFLAGGTLSDRLRAGPLAPDDALALGVTLADALARLHEAGVLHRDVKPSNIGFAADGTPRLLDFGLARIVGIADEAWRPGSWSGAAVSADAWQSVPGLTGKRSVMGTPLYLPPEALSGAEPNPGFDLWSLALVLYESIAGRNPLRAATVDATLANVGKGTVPLLRAYVPECHPELEAWFASALHADPGRRPAGAAACRQALIRLASDLFPAA